MKLKKLLALLICLALAVGIISGCGSEQAEPAPVSDAPAEEAPAKESPQEESGTRTITDMAGRTVELPNEVKTVVGMTFTGRLCTYAGAGDRMVGLSRQEINGNPIMPYTIVMHDTFKDAVDVGSGSEPNIEAIASLEPDVVLVEYTEITGVDTMQEKLNGIPVVALSLWTDLFSQEFYDSLTLVGEIMGTQEHTEQVIEAMKGWAKDLDNRTKDIPDSQKPTVYTGAVSYFGAHGIEGTFAQYPPFDAIHAKNVVDATDEKGAFNIEKEQLLVWDPDIIFLTPNNMNLVNEDYALNPDYYNSLKAVQDGKVYSQVAYIWCYTNFELAIIDAYYAGKVMFQEQFADVNFEEKADEIFTVMLGEPYLQTLNESGNSFGPITIGE